MSHPPTHPGWNHVVLVGGPSDGQELTIRGSRNIIVMGVTNSHEVDLSSMEKGAVYLTVREPGEFRPSNQPERFHFIGHRTTRQIRLMLKGGYVAGGDLDDDPADDWKK